jgi:hypothetical protein
MIESASASTNVRHTRGKKKTAIDDHLLGGDGSEETENGRSHFLDFRILLL